MDKFDLNKTSQNQSSEIHGKNKGCGYDFINTIGLSKAERVAAIIAAVPGIVLGSELEENNKGAVDIVPTN